VVVQAAEPVPLSQCIEQALQASHQRAVSQANLRIAEAQLNQALSARWPEAAIEITGTRRDQDPDFILPGNSLSLGAAAAPIAEAVAATQLTKAGITPASVGQAAYNAQLAAATQAALSQVGNIATPTTDVKLAGRDNLLTSLQAHLPLYTGGKVDAVIRQARAGVAAAKADAVATDLQIVQDVRRFYYGCVLSHKLRAIGQEGLERMVQVQTLAEMLAKSGSGKVKPTDLTRARLVVASLKSLAVQLRSNEDLASTALATVMGMPWDATVQPADQEVPALEDAGELPKLVARAQSLNPRVLQVGYGMAAAQAGIDQARAGHLPVVVLFGSLDHIDNDFHAGLTSDTNRNGWTLGIRVQVPLFSGFRVENEVREASARKDKLASQQKLLDLGLGAQVKSAFIELARSEEQTRTTAEALAAAHLNREAHEQAFMASAVEAKDVVEAQLTELFIAGQHQQARFEAQCSQGQLQALIGEGLGAVRN
jgi:outer membrane protein TolC